MHLLFKQYPILFKKQIRFSIAGSSFLSLILPCYILIFCAARAMDASNATSRFSSIWPQ